MHLTPAQQQQLRELMQGRRLTQSTVAQEIGLSQSAISHYLSGRRDLSPDYRKALYKLLGERPETAYLLEETGQRKMKDDWERMFDRRVANLRTVYNSQIPRNRGEILGELERMIETYGVQPEPISSPSPTRD